MSDIYPHVYITEEKKVKSEIHELRKILQKIHQNYQIMDMKLRLKQWELQNISQFKSNRRGKCEK